LPATNGGNKKMIRTVELTLADAMKRGYVAEEGMSIYIDCIDIVDDNGIITASATYSENGNSSSEEPFECKDLKMSLDGLDWEEE